jgi:hypothetical protein
MVAGSVDGTDDNCMASGIFTSSMLVSMVAKRVESKGYAIAGADVERRYRLFWCVACEGLLASNLAMTCKADTQRARE